MSEMQVAHDFVRESDALHALLRPLDDAAFAEATLFKGWSINRVLRHLHFWNYAAHLSLTEPAQFDNLMGQLTKKSAGRGSRGSKKAAANADMSAAMEAMETQFADGAEGRLLCDLWRGFYRPMGLRFAETSPKTRVRWAGPDMSARSSITARLMETWSHGQAVYDALGAEREAHDYIKNIAVLGVNTFGWSFRVHGHEVPETPPYLALTAPSGAVWEWHEKSESDYIKGPAQDFCQVVTQCRNIADVGLEVRGEVATRWMAEAQCFAGGPETPPPPGARHKKA